jgi:hypothetical protein
MTTAELEKRLTSLEREVHQLKRSIRSAQSKDWRRVVGLFADDKDFRKMVRLGKAYRKKQTDGGR